jgi:hypothetical protein
MRIVSYRSGKVWVEKKLKEKKSIPSDKDGKKDGEKVKILLTMFYSDGLI